jgi:hypothetical protein
VRPGAGLGRQPRSPRHGHLRFVARRGAVVVPHAEVQSVDFFVAARRRNPLIFVLQNEQNQNLVLHPHPTYVVIDRDTTPLAVLELRHEVLLLFLVVGVRGVRDLHTSHYQLQLLVQDVDDVALDLIGDHAVVILAFVQRRHDQDATLDLEKEKNLIRVLSL